MADITKSLTMPNGQELVFVGKQWYGVCTTVAATQAKTVSITGFTSADLVAGARVTVQFNYAQTYNGVPTLNVSSTGAKFILRRASSNGTSESTGRYEWSENSIITFTYSGYGWVIEDGERATTTYLGKTILSNAIGNDQTTALTPYAVNQKGYMRVLELGQYVWDGSEPAIINCYTGTLPSADQWYFEDDRAYLTINPGTLSAINNGARFRLIKISYRDSAVYYTHTGTGTLTGFNCSTHNPFFVYYSVFGIDNGGSVEIEMDADKAGAYPLTIDLFYNSGTGLVSYPQLSQYLDNAGYLTLATLPIWDGGVI